MAVLKADVTKLPAYVGVELPGQGYAVYRIGKVWRQPAQVDDSAPRRRKPQQIAGCAGAAGNCYNYRRRACKTKSKSRSTSRRVQRRPGGSNSGTGRRRM